jgi:hypothetical protein
MDLSTFGAIMKFAIDGEHHINSLLESGKGVEALSSVSSTIDSIMKLSLKNMKLVERCRRENVNEMILQPIAGIDKNLYVMADKDLSTLSSHEYKLYLKAKMENLIKFYTEVGPAQPIKEVNRSFQMLIKKNRRMIGML